MKRIKLIHIVCFLAVITLMTVPGYIFADEDTPRQGKVRLLVKFKEFIGDRIEIKLANEDLVVDEELTEWILKKIDKKYNLKKLKKLVEDKTFNEKNSGSSIRELDDYYVIEVNRSKEYTDWVSSRLTKFYEIDAVEVDIKVDINNAEYYENPPIPLPQVSYTPNDKYITNNGTHWYSNSNAFMDMYGLYLLKVFQAWDLFRDPKNDPGKGIVVAVVDTGADFSHPDLSQTAWANPNEIADNNKDDDENGYVDDVNGWNFVVNSNSTLDGHGHGTHVSGTIAADTNNNIGIAGVAPNAKIMVLKGLNDSGSGYISWLANCIIYAADNGANVISNSWGGNGTSSALEMAMEYAYSKNCVIVAAAGNSNSEVSDFLPANIPCVMSVAATDAYDHKANFSNFGTSIDVSAPGSLIMSTTGSGYAKWNGTSMACPHVSGIAALMLSLEPDLLNYEIRERIKDTTHNIYDLGSNSDWEGQLGTGRVDAYKALMAGNSTKSNSPVLATIGNKTINVGEVLSFTVEAEDADNDPLIYSAYTSLPGGLEKNGNADFFMQKDTVYEGQRALQSGNIGSKGFSAVSKNVAMAKEGEISFYWKISSKGKKNELGFYIDEIKQSEIKNNVPWRKEVFYLGAGEHVLKWIYKNKSNSTSKLDAGWLDNICITSGSLTNHDFEDGLLPGDFKTGGDKPNSFYAQDGQAHNGQYALMSNPSIEDKQKAWISKDVTSAGNAEISFWWKVSSEYYYDFLEFYINNELQARISGYTEWEKKTYNLPSGTHELKWQYAKDWSLGRGSDVGWVDDISIDSLTEEVLDFEPNDFEPNPLPQGASFNPDTRTFTWVPVSRQIGEYAGLRFIVTEDTLQQRSDYEDIIISVLDPPNRAPVLSAIGNKNVDENALLEFSVSGTDPDGDELAYKALNLPEGASFNGNTRKFSWMPNYEQAGLYNNIRFIIEESSETESLSTKAAENTKLLLHFNGEEGETHFEDSSQEKHTVHSIGNTSITNNIKKWGTGALNLSGGGNSLKLKDSPDWDILSSSDEDWTIDFNIKFNGPQGYEYIISQYGNIASKWGLRHLAGSGFKFEVSSNGATVLDTGDGGKIQDTQWHHVALCKVGTEYGIYVDGNQANYTACPITADIAGDIVIGRRGDGIQSFNGYMDEIRIIQGNPFEALPNQSSSDTIEVPSSEHGNNTNENQVPDEKYSDYEDISINVKNINRAPCLEKIGKKSIKHGEELVFSINATDPDNDVLAYTAANLPGGAIFDTLLNTFKWAPSSEQAGNNFNIRFEVSDGEFVDTEDTKIKVGYGNRKPVINSIASQPAITVNEGEIISIVINASDPDGDNLIYSVCNNPDGSGFVDNNFYWVPGYDDSGVYEGISFTVFDGALYSDSSDPITITVNNAKDAPSFITEPILVSSYNINGGVRDIAISGNYAYAAHGSDGLMVLDVSKINNITETDAINYSNLDKINIFDNYAYAVNAENSIEVLDITAPGSPYIRGNMLADKAKDVAVGKDIAFIASNKDIVLYDLEDKNQPQCLDGYEMGKADRMAAENDYIYVVSAEEGLSIIDINSMEKLSTSPIPGRANMEPKDIAVTGNDLYIAKEEDGIIYFNLNDPLNPSQDGNFTVSNIAIRHVRAFIKDKLFAAGYNNNTNQYTVLYIDANDNTNLMQSWAYPLQEGLGINNINLDGNKIYTANEKGVDIIVSPLDETYTIDIESEFKITVYAVDPDGDSIEYTINNKPIFDEAVFTDNNDGSATFAWTPSKDQVGTYANISFTATDSCQEATSGYITIMVTEKDVSITENTKLLLHFNGEEGETHFEDSSQEKHTVHSIGNTSITNNIKKWGTGALNLSGGGNSLKLKDSPDWDILSSSDEDWTIDFNIKFNGPQGYEYIISQYGNIASKWGLRHLAGSGFKFEVSSNGATVLDTGDGGKIQDTQWHHVALCKVGTEYGIYVDGNQANYTACPITADIAGDIVIGRRGDGIQSFNGYMDEIRIIQGNPFEALPNQSSSDTIEVPSSESR